MSVMQAMLKSAWARMSSSLTPEESKHALVLVVLYVCTAWFYFRVAHYLPVVVDMLFPLWYCPVLFLSMRGIDRKFGLEVRRKADVEDVQDEPHWRESALNRNGLFASIFAICWGWWIYLDHTGRFPTEWALVPVVVGMLGIFLVPCVNALAGVTRSRLAARRRGGESQ